MYEQALAHQMFSHQTEKSYIDKITSKDEVVRLRELIRKTELSREDIGEIFNILVGAESKLVNYSENDRYIILKYHVWIREFVKLADGIAGNNLDLLEKDKNGTIKLSPTHRALLNRNNQVIQGAVKQLIEVYLNIARTSLSVRGAAFDKLLANKYEVVYPQPHGAQVVEQKKSWWGGK